MKQKQTHRIRKQTYRISWGSRISRCTLALICVQQTNKNLLCSTGGSTQSFVITYIHIYVAYREHTCIKLNHLMYA